MKLMIYKDSTWLDFSEQADSILTDALDGYSGSEKTAFLKIVKEDTDPILNHLILRFVHLFNNEEIPLTTIENTPSVEISNGDPVLKNKVQYSLKTQIDLNNIQTGIDIIPDENAMFLIGDLNDSTNEIMFSLKTKVLPRIITDFSQKINLSDVYIQFYYSE